jgi:hypothetical protein
MSAAKFIIFSVLSVVFLYFTITSIQHLIVAGKEVEKAQEEYDIAVAENEAAQQEFQNVVKYGCANPTVMTGLVSCPNG